MKRPLYFFFLIAIVRGYPQGAPHKVCFNLLPTHSQGTIAPQTEPTPFGLQVFNAEEGSLLVSVKSPLELPFQGLMIQGRTPDGRILGSFEAVEGVKTINCTQMDDSLTHSSPDKKTAVEVLWRPPENYEGLVMFNSTILQDYSTFWVGVESEQIPISKRNTGPNLPPQSTPTHRTPTTPHYFPESTTKPSMPTNPFYDGCDSSKLCFGTPSGCVSAQSCKAVVAVNVKGDRYEFELRAENAAWVGVGLSTDKQMGDDSVIECVRNRDAVKSYMSWTSPRPNLGVSRLANNQMGIQQLAGNARDGAIYCKVIRDARTVVNGRVFDLAAEKYYMLVAAGSSVEANSVGFHDVAYEASASDLFLSEVSAVGGASKLLLRLHGCFMLAAWIGTCSIGTFIARYFRKTWVGKTLCGKDLWFAWHRMFMVLTWALTVVAFILIFVELQAWSTESNPHAILGVVVTALCCLQPIGAFFRPHPGTKSRPYFNWLHWLGGNSAHIIAIITIFFAVKLNKAQLPNWFDWILVAYVAFHVVMHLILSIVGCISDNSTNQRVTAFPMKDLNSSNKMSAHMISADAPFSSSRKFLLGLYIFVVGGISAALIVITALAPIES